MPDSAPSAIFTATSPAQAAPAPPVINSVTFNRLRATVNVTLPIADAEGSAYTPAMFFAAVKIFFGPTGTLTPESVPVSFPDVPENGLEPLTTVHSFLPGQQHDFEVDVPAWATAYDFEAEVSI